MQHLTPLSQLPKQSEHGDKRDTMWVVLIVLLFGAKFPIDRLTNKRQTQIRLFESCKHVSSYKETHLSFYVVVQLGVIGK